MGLREQLGGMLESALNEAVDKHLDADLLKEQVGKLIDERVEDLKHKLKAEIIDKIDGEDDIPDAE